MMTVPYTCSTMQVVHPSYSDLSHCLEGGTKGIRIQLLEYSLLARTVDLNYGN